jgi:mRNA interferase RelE/StbE
VSYRVALARSAGRELDALPPDVRERVAGALQRLGENPRPHGARKLAYGPGWRLRVGDYRVLYTISDESRLVAVFAIGHRREVYRP